MANKIERKKVNNIHSAKSKGGKALNLQEFQTGDIAFVKSHGSKHETRDPYLVTGHDDEKIKLHKVHFLNYDQFLKDHLLSIWFYSIEYILLGIIGLFWTIKNKTKQIQPEI